MPEVPVDRLIRVLIVDDSAFVRRAVTQMLSRSPFMEVVGAAHDGREALELVEQLQPDVVTLDLIMPSMDGVEFLRTQMARRPIPVIVVSIASELGELALKALDAGAIDFVQKPTALATDRVLEISDELIEKVKAAASVQLGHLIATPDGRPPGTPLTVARHAGAVDAVVIGISTGGPQALRYLIPQFPADLPVPVAMVLHMPVGYTDMYARKLNDISDVEVVEAREGDVMRPGRALLAPAGRHLSLRRLADASVVAHLDARPFDATYRPSVDVLFQSAAEVYGSRVLGIVMTGMGSDGKQGAAWIKSQGGLVFTEAEQSCVVYGMPRAVVEAGLSDRSLPLDEIARAVLEVL